MVIDNEYFDTMDIYNFIWIKDGFCRANGNYFCGFVFVVYQKTTEKLGLQLLYSIITSIGMVFLPI